MLTLRNDTPTARKFHRCDDCGRQIAPGEKYRNQANVGDDGVYTWKSCVQCEALAHWIFRNDPYAVDYDYGLDVGEWVAEYASDELKAQFRSRWDGVAVDGVALPVSPEEEK